MNKKGKPDSPFAPVAKTDTLTSVYIYKRTADPYDNNHAILVCVFERKNRDLAKVAASQYGTETIYVKVAAAPFSFHTDASGCLVWHVGGVIGQRGHFNAWEKLGGIKHVRVTSMDPYHGSESSKKLGIAAQTMDIEVKAGIVLEYTKIQPINQWWETMDDGRFHPESPVFHADSEYRWHGNPIVWVGGLTLDAIKADQQAANRDMADREAERETRRREHARAVLEAQLVAETAPEAQQTPQDAPPTQDNGNGGSDLPS